MKTATKPSPRRYPFPRRIARSMERAGNLHLAPRILVKPDAPVADKIEVVKTSKIKTAFQGFKAKLARALRSMRGQ